MLCLDYGYRLADRPSDLTRPQINFLVAALSDRLDKLASAESTEAGVTKFVFTDDEEQE